MTPIMEEEKNQIRMKLIEYREEIFTKYDTLGERLEAIRKMFTVFIPELEKKHLTQEELEKSIYLPDDVRIIFYEVFPEHGLNMAKYAEELHEKLMTKRNFNSSYALYLRHNN